MPTKIWLQAGDVFPATMMYILNNCKSVDAFPHDGYCFEKPIGFNSSELPRLFLNFPATVVAYPTGNDFVSDPRSAHSKV